MCGQNVRQSDEPRKPLAIEPASETRRRTSTSRTKEFHNINGADPEWPRPVYRGRNIYYVSSEVDRYLERVIARGRDNPPEGMPDRLAEALDRRNGE
jgi:predicted DNA-binding transcriptional regulator AlpA